MGKHFYYSDGTPAYTIPKKSGKGEKCPTIKDARELGLYPSVTTIIGDVKRKPAMENWRLWKYGEAVWNDLWGPSPKHLEHDITFNPWHSRNKEEAFASVETAADIGTQIHLIVESVINNVEIPDVEMEVSPELMVGFSEVWNGLGLRVEKTEYNTVHPLGYAGRGDLVASDEVGYVFVDWKTRDTKPGKPIDFYSELPVQLAAYSKAYLDKLPHAHLPRLISVVISRNEQGRVEYREWPQSQFKHYWSSFIGLFHNWCGDNEYWPGGEFTLEPRMEE
jgi:hypothetical protein